MSTKLLRKVFCSLSNQVAVNPPIGSHVSPKDHFAKVIRLVRHTLHFCKVCDFYVKKENKKSNESIRDHHENARKESAY